MIYAFDNAVDFCFIIKISVNNMGEDIPGGKKDMLCVKQKSEFLLKMCSCQLVEGP